MEKFLPWFALKSVPGIGNHLYKRIIEKFKFPELAFEASSESLLKVRGISEKIILAIKQHKIPDWVKRDIDLLIEKKYSIITMSDPDYPQLLLQIPDPPPFLYVYGKLQKSIKNIAVVGSRNATNYGIATTKRICSDLVKFNMVIISGMARGIDTAAHTGALNEKGKTIAVLGSGLEKVYPKENKELFHQIAQEGAVISEFPLLKDPEPYNFPLRNRIISGISLGVVIVEAAKKSGSLITARLALEQNREVFAVPGNIHSFKSEGTHGLIKQGAKLVENVKDIIDEIEPFICEHDKNDYIDKDTNLPNPLNLSDEELIVYDALGTYPMHIDELVRKIQIEPGKLLSILLMLELKGMVQKSPGNFFSKESYS